VSARLAVNTFVDGSERSRVVATYRFIDFSVEELAIGVSNSGPGRVAQPTNTPVSIARKANRRVGPRQPDQTLMLTVARPIYAGPTISGRSEGPATLRQQPVLHLCWWRREIGLDVNRAPHALRRCAVEPDAEGAVASELTPLP
jgi:hypothetical protein